MAESGGRIKTGNEEGFPSHQKVQKPKPELLPAGRGFAGPARRGSKYQYYPVSMWDIWSQADPSIKSAGPLTGCVPLGKSTDLSVPPFPLLKGGDENTYFYRGQAGGGENEDEGDCR